MCEESPRGSSHSAPWVVTWLTWPCMFAATVAMTSLAIHAHWTFGPVLMSLFLAEVGVLIALEFAFPLDPRWRMTSKTFLGRDLKFFIGQTVWFPATTQLFALAAIRLNGSHIGPITHWPLWLSVPFVILAHDFLQYWQHRWSHEADTAVKRFLWKTHAAHHLPEQVYVFMHPVAHPINAGLIVRGITTIGIFYVLGASPATVFVAAALGGLQGLVSHCNVDLRAGWLNYILVGTELHRFHHSSNIEEAKNYGVIVSVFDILFGTFVYKPGTQPERLGVAHPEAYPGSDQFWRIMLMPFRNKVTASNS